jgi:hypothetical protein
MFCLPGCLRTFVFVLLLVLLPLSEASATVSLALDFFLPHWRPTIRASRMRCRFRP